MTEVSCNYCGRRTWPGTKEGLMDRIYPTSEVLPIELLKQLVDVPEDHHLCMVCMGNLKTVIRAFFRKEKL